MLRTILPLILNYPIEEQVISAQLFPRSIKWLNPNLSDVLSSYNLYRLKRGLNYPYI